MKSGTVGLPLELLTNGMLKNVPAFTTGKHSVELQKGSAPKS